jgi:hypothetical protein
MTLGDPEIGIISPRGRLEKGEKDRPLRREWAGGHKYVASNILKIRASEKDAIYFYALSLSCRDMSLGHLCNGRIWSKG